jgi:hypothetical protein
MTRIAILTYDKLPELSPDDQLLKEQLIQSGYSVEAYVWDKLPNDASADLFIVRSIWDYHKKHERFLKFLKMAESTAINIQNPVSILRWNSDKMYLKELKVNGLPIVPTFWLNHKEKNVTLSDIIQDQEWSDVIVKPVVSASALRTKRVLLKDVEHFEPLFQQWLSEHSLMVQPFFSEICTFGEWSLIYLGGDYSHAVLKTPKEGDFRVQEEYGGTTRRLEPPATFRKLGDRINDFLHKKFNGPSLYARIDLLDYAGHPLIGELELIEPFLFLSHEPGAGQKMARAVSSSLIRKL